MSICESHTISGRSLPHSVYSFQFHKQIARVSFWLLWTRTHPTMHMTLKDHPHSYVCPCQFNNCFSLLSLLIVFHACALTATIRESSSDSLSWVFQKVCNLLCDNVNFSGVSGTAYCPCDLPLRDDWYSTSSNSWCSLRRRLLNDVRDIVMANCLYFQHLVQCQIHPSQRVLVDLL